MARSAMTSTPVWPRASSFATLIPSGTRATRTATAQAISATTRAPASQAMPPATTAPRTAIRILAELPSRRGSDAGALASTVGEVTGGALIITSVDPGAGRQQSRPASLGGAVSPFRARAWKVRLSSNPT